MLHIVRHGRTSHNASGRLLGRLDIALDDRGVRQARALADVLPAPSKVITSPLLRTRATAEMIAESTGAALVVDERWIELDYGDLDGVALRDVAPETWKAWRADLDFRPPGGETLRELGARVRTAADEVLDEARERDVVVVTHVSPIKAAMCWALGVDDTAVWRAFVAPASITRVAAGPVGPSLHAFNDTAHLGSDG